MRNFDYIKDLGFDDLHRYCSAAEETQVCDPEMSAFHCRRALEYMVRELYVMKGIVIPERTSLLQMVDDESFSKFINDPKVMMAVHYVRKVGNHGAHAMKVTKQESFFCLLNIYNVVAAILLKLQLIQTVKPFDKNLIPGKPNIHVVPPAEIKVSESDAIVKQANKEAVESTDPVVEMDCPDLSEDDTRKMFINLMLKEAGWEVMEKEGLIQPLKACIEIEVDGMPTTSKKGYADYVLFGSNGKPLAVVEAKRTSKSPDAGKHQAELYADCLEAKYGVRPVIYYTNGFETYIIDGLGYPPRRLYCFHTATDLELMIQKRSRHDINDFKVNGKITDRDYQKMSIKAVCEHFNKKHRKGLIVMATGTGKTRVAISLVDILTRNEWVKNALFLADRTSLVNQAHKNFVKLLPNMTTCVLSDDSDHDLNARLTFSTYQTMINHIDTEDKTFSVGRFDLIIIDEAHRSIFGKYGAIFNYFDSLLIGLTATPRDEVDRSTYEIFEMEQGEPNFAYELEEAVADGYLVNYIGIKRGSKIMREGIKYDELSPEEKAQLEKVFEYERINKALEGEPGRDIAASEIFTYIFNDDTISHVLQDLMSNGLKIKGSEEIGKTIIFAYNHRHAEMIVEKFNKLFPEYGPDYCALIDNYVTYADDLIDKFADKNKEPQIAVSVDMLDTGIDVPEVINLVFFKQIRSKIKFMQMVGRGTRLCKDLFGPGKDKECFYIFDWCGNLDYFNKGNEGVGTKATISLTERIFNLRSEIAYYLQAEEYQEDPYTKTLHDSIKDQLRSAVNILSDSHISVRMKWENVCHFREDGTWVCLSQKDVDSLKEDISPLVPKSKTDESAKKFDLLILAIELAYLDGKTKCGRQKNSVQTIAHTLLTKKATLPAVQKKKAILNEVLNDVAWDNADLQWYEKVREEIRELLKFLTDEGRWFVVNIDDVVTDEGVSDGITPAVSYKQKVFDFLAENRDLPVLQKIINIEQLTSEDVVELERIMWKELGSKEDYDKYTDGKMCGPNVAIFIRSIIGVDRDKAVKRFSELISASELNYEQEEFIKSILTYVCENGDITKEIVVNEDPFASSLETFGSEYLAPLAQYVDSIHKAVVAG